MSTSSATVIEAILQAAREVLGEIDTSGVGPDHRLRDLGANSIDRVEIVTLSMEALGVELPLVSLAGARNIGELARLLEEELRAKGGA